jgi:hypothetical protein
LLANLIRDAGRISHFEARNIGAQGGFLPSRNG